MSFDSARSLADAVLLEGYVLYPYRASSAKNQYRFTFGVLAPRPWSEAGGCEPFALEARCLAAPPGERLRGLLRFLRVERRQVHLREGDAFRPVERCEVAGRLAVSFEEGISAEIPFELDPREPLATSFALPESFEVEELRDERGEVAARVERRREAVAGRVAASARELPGDRPLLELTVRAENVTPWEAPGAPRAEAVRRSLASTHLLLALEGGRFLSLQDPPDWAAEAARGCRCSGTYPVLAGPPDRDDLLLCAPIILYDHARLAPESPTAFYDACEIDELLVLRTLGLTPEEQREARATDPRSAALLEACLALSSGDRDRLHGAERVLASGEMVPKMPLRPGSRVRLRPRRRTDAQDLLVAGAIARVEELRHDVDGRTFVGVTLEDDPAAPLLREQRRYRHYGLDEVEPLSEEGA